MQVQWAPSPNYRSGRQGRSIIAIVNHITAGLMPGTLSWLSNPAAKASAHYLVTKSGVVYQLVKDEDTAWHAGIINKPDWILYDGSNPNYYTLGIEHEALAGEALSEAQYQATLGLHRQMINKHKILADRDHIIGHYRLDSINRRNDPGPGFPWDRLFNDLSRFNEVLNPAGITIIAGSKNIKGFLEGDIAYGPVREIAIALGWQVEWLNQTRQVILLPPVKEDISKKDGVSIIITNRKLSATIRSDTAFAPLRQLTESMGYQVDWNEKNRTVKIREA
jgi:N-acetylmuramoyl-L-alanine amidase